MPKYFFHLYEDLEALDEEGQEFGSLEEARAVGLAAVRSIMAEQVVKDGRVLMSSRIDLADEAGTVFESISFADAVELVNAPETPPFVSPMSGFHSSNEDPLLA